MENLVQSAVSLVNKSKTAFCKFISANDAGKTGAHQAGFYMPKNAVSLMFDQPGIRGENKDRFITIKWQNDFETASRFIYYGKGTRNEYRLTRFGKGFPFLTDDNVGDLFVLAHFEEDFYNGFVFSTDEDIEAFLSAFGLSPAQTNQLIPKNVEIDPEYELLQCFLNFIRPLKVDFPSTYDLASNARNCYNIAYKITSKIIREKPDTCLLKWIHAEYELFKTFENDRYKEIIKTPFQTVEELVTTANSILNRRKSRAGKSLEHHLSEVFSIFDLKFDTQAITEGKKKPDFLFPGAEAYHNKNFNSDKLLFLGAKTTCKDRWRQILNEADRIKNKHLFTLQQGISKNQLTEMSKYGVTLVVPKSYKSAFPKAFQDKILNLNDFVQLAQSNQIM